MSAPTETLENRPTAPRPNQFRHRTDLRETRSFRDGRWRTFEPPPPVERTLRGRAALLRPGLTFTPYANPTPCTARCAFCSEELLRVDGDRLTAHRTIEDHGRYFAGLDRAWRELEGFPMGLSLSGLEASSDGAWLLSLLALLDRHDALLPTRVLYSNGSGLCSDDRLLPALARARFDRVELSRAHFDAKINQRIMRFNLGEPVRGAEAFARTVRRAQVEGVPVRLVCILNTDGVCTIEQVEDYLSHARALGVRSVVFRELSVLGDRYHDSRHSRWIDARRASVRALMERIAPSDGADECHPTLSNVRDGWALEGVTAGYYYYNEVYRREGVEVVLEGSSYVAHHDAVASGVVQKLVFHSSGDLCGDWVPNAQVLGNYFDP
jgi:hypothetical protein